MAIGDPLSKIWTYQKVIDMARLRSATLGDSTIPSALALDLVSLNVQTIAKRITDSGGYYAKQYLIKNATLTISGSVNPYVVDISSINPFLDKPEKIVHVTTGGVRTQVELYSPAYSEYQSALSNNANSIFGAYVGDSLLLFKGSAFTVTIATDTVEFWYYRQAKIGSVASNAVVSDVAYTVAADGLTVSAFTGVLTSHVGGTLVGIDNASAPFARTINQYVSSTSFILATTVAAGAATNGYIIPPAANTYTTTTGTYVDVPDPLGELLLTMTAADFSRHKNGGQPDLSLDTRSAQMLDAISSQGMLEKQMSKRDE